MPIVVLKGISLQEPQFLLQKWLLTFQNERAFYRALTMLLAATAMGFLQGFIGDNVLHTTFN